MMNSSDCWCCCQCFSLLSNFINIILRDLSPMIYSRYPYDKRKQINNYTIKWALYNPKRCTPKYLCNNKYKYIYHKFGSCYSFLLFVFVAIVDVPCLVSVTLFPFHTHPPALILSLFLSFLFLFRSLSCAVSALHFPLEIWNVNNLLNNKCFLTSFAPITYTYIIYIFTKSQW